MIHVETYTPLRFASFTVLTARSMTGFMDLSCQPNQMQLWFGATQISLSVYRRSSGLSNTLVLFSWVSKSKESTCTLAAKFELISISHWENGGFSSGDGGTVWGWWIPTIFLVNPTNQLRAWGFDPSFLKQLLPAPGARPLHSCRPTTFWISAEEICWNEDFSGWRRTKPLR